MSGYVGAQKLENKTKSLEIDISAPELAEAWKSVTADKQPNNWCAFTYADADKSDTLVVASQGEKGFSELKSYLANDCGSKVVFGAFRVECSDREHSGGGGGVARPKFVSFCYVGGSVSEYDRAGSNFQKKKIATIFSSVHMTMDLRGNELDDLFTPSEITKSMHTACAAHKPSHYNFLDGEAEVAVKDVLEGGDDSEESEEDFD